jgi:hypothetical protein
MRRISKALLAIGACALATVAVAEPGEAAGGVTATKDDCMNAHAIIMASHPTVHAGFPHPEYCEAILNVVKWHRHWTVAPEYEPGVSQKFSLKKWDTKFHEGGTAYVAHCGHGATCNEVARVVLKAYPEIPSPVVYCGEVPHILDNPSGC